jgi:uncharacterized protein (TIGR02270 family)
MNPPDMNSTELQRPVGFRPDEISTLINETVIEQHAEEAAFLWMLRDRAVGAPNYKLKDLLRLDGRVEAHLDGLRNAGHFGRQLCQRMLDNKEAGDGFAAGVVAFDSGDLALIRKISISCTVGQLARGLVSALGWLPFDKVEKRIAEFLSSEHAAERRIGIAASAIHRVDPGVALREAIADSDPFLRARALQAVGELGRLELLPRLRTGYTDPVKNIRFAAAWSATRLSENLDSLAVLRTFAESADPRAYQALRIAIGRMDLASSKLWQASLANKKETSRLAVVAAGAIGDPALVPWLIAQMQFPLVARMAGQAFAMMTGVDLAYEDLDREKPVDFEAGPTENPQDENVETEQDADLRWPGPELVAEWWKKNAHRFASGRRYLFGKEISTASLREVLAHGYQPHRTAAALELALRRPTEPLFEVRARATAQLKDLKRWNW